MDEKISLLIKKFYRNAIAVLTLFDSLSEMKMTQKLYF